MKKLIISLLILATTIFCIGCKKHRDEPTVLFYYPRAEYTYNSADSVITSELRSNADGQSAKDLLSVYLRGPDSPALINPFPRDISVIAVHTDGTTLFITVSDHLAELTDTDLIVACASLAKTGMGIAEADAVHIECESLLLNGNRSITINHDSIIYLDELPQATAGTE